MDTNLATPIIVADVAQTTSLITSSAGRDVGLAILAAVMNAPDNIITVLPIDFSGVSVISGEAATRITAALSGVVHTYWQRHFYLTGFSQVSPVADSLRAAFINSFIVTILKHNETITVFGRIRMVRQALPLLDDLRTLTSWMSVDDVVRSQLASVQSEKPGKKPKELEQWARSCLERLYEAGLVMKEENITVDRNRYMALQL